jgi:predicted Zn-ribbon and HTH transcriptional regulator
MKIKSIESRLKNKGYSISYCPRQDRKCGFVLKLNGFIKHIFDSPNQAAKHFGFI